MAHHGMNDQHGINAMCKHDTEHEGRFGRMFPDLSSNYNRPGELSALGGITGPMDGGEDRLPSTSLPLGFVFLGQFIDHDITLDTTSSLSRVNDPDATQNFRTPALDLDCIYGAGPEASNYLYRQGMYLLTGADGTAAPGQQQGHAEHDLVRSSEGTAIIGDPRNDENRIISQMQLAFIRFHNNVVDHVINEHGYTAAQLANPALRKEVYEEARELVTWHYQWIVINEFLPLMVGQPMVNRVLSRGRQYYRPRKTPFIPIEFSAAAYRFGHSLAPQSMRTQPGQANAFDLFGADLGIGFRPVNHDRQIVDWSMFFASDPGQEPQMTDRLDTNLPSILLQLPFIDPRDEQSLATRNLLRGQSFLLPSGELIAETTGMEEEDREQLDDFIRDQTRDVGLSNDTPLWYYILAEAELFGRNDGNDRLPGEGLGLVGGTIVCETLIGLIELDASSYLGSNRNWTPSLGNGDDFTMADMVNFEP